jgi:hypothetical protein
MAVVGYDQQQAIGTPDAARARVSADAFARYGASAESREWLEAIVRQAVDEIWSDDLRIRTYVPVLAMRRVRELIELDNA